jgi:hypothetical protein
VSRGSATEPSSSRSESLIALSIARPLTGAPSGSRASHPSVALDEHQ